MRDKPALSAGGPGVEKSATQQRLPCPLWKSSDCWQPIRRETFTGDHFKEAVTVSAHLPHNNNSIFIVIVKINILLQLAKRKIAPSSICFASLLLSTTFPACYIFINGDSVDIFHTLSKKKKTTSFLSLFCLTLYPIVLFFCFLKFCFCLTNVLLCFCFHFNSACLIYDAENFRLLGYCEVRLVPQCQDEQTIFPPIT